MHQGTTCASTQRQGKKEAKKAMLMTMKITGKAGQEAAYHCHEENYYFEQSSGVETVMENDVKVEQKDRGLSHVKVYGNCAELLVLRMASP